MYYTIDNTFPDWFKLKSLNADLSFGEVNIADVQGWKVVYFYPKDFTFVCPTEIVDFDNHIVEFCKLNATVFGVSPDNEFCKLAWRNEHPQLKNLNHALLSDSGNKLSEELGIVSFENVPFRATFIIDADNIIQYVGVHGLSVGRSAAEVLRVLDACQKGEEGMLCPAARPVGGATI
jgi:peroxiredoxin (alkyl hydroperoxide reductase subunit C)